MESPLLRALRIVRRRTVVSEPDIQAELGIQPRRRQEIVGRLKKLGLLVVVADPRGAHLRFAPELGVVVGIDLHHETALIALSDMTLAPLGSTALVRALRRVPDLDPTDADSTIDALAEAVANRLDEDELKGMPLVGVGVAVPAPVSRKTGIPAEGYLNETWKNVAVAQRLEARLLAYNVETRVVVGNDASLGALGIHTRARLENPWAAPADLMYIRVSRGIGAGVVLKGHSVTGGDGIAGEVGHIRVDYSESAPLCTRCGGSGCLELLAGETAVEQRLAAAGLPREVLASQRTKVGGEALADAGRLLGRAVAHGATLLNPTWAVLRGTMPQSEAYMKSARHEFEKRTTKEVFAACDFRRWDELVAEWSDGNPVVSAVGRTKPDMSPELFGALAFVIDELGDEHLAKWLERSEAAPAPAPAPGAGAGTREGDAETATEVSGGVETPAAGST